MKRFLFVCVLLLVFGGARAVQACSCSLELGTLKEKVTRAKSDSAAVFVGKLTKLEEPKNGDGSFTGEVIAHFEVEKVWKGSKSAEIVVHTTNICCICGFPFEEGVRYVVYAYSGNDKDRLATSICTRTAPVGADGIEGEKYLGKPTSIERKKVALDSIH